MPRVFIAVGSNIHPAENVRKAIEILRGEVRVTAISTFFRTRPLNRPGQPDFYNGVMEVETDTPPVELKQEILRSTEEALGRKRDADRNAARTIDLDIIVYDDLVVNTEELTLPDPEIARRPFLAVPLSELAPDMTLPGSGQTSAEVAGRFAHHNMEPLFEFTETLRKELADEPREG